MAGPNFRGMAVFPFILVKGDKLLADKVLINHERIHIRQQLEMLVLPFYLLYLADFLYKWWKYKSVSAGYYKNIFEVEAYANQKNIGYLNKRPFWNFLKYWKK